MKRTLLARTLRAALVLLAIAAGAHVARAVVVFDLYISDDQGLNHYNSQSGMLTNIVPESAEAFGFTGVAIGPNGNLFAAASGAPGSQIWQYDRETGAQIGPGPFVFYHGTPPTPDPHDVIIPTGIAFSPTNQQLYVADQGVHNVHVYDENGDSVGFLTDDSLVQPPDVAFDADGNLYVASFGVPNVLTSPDGTAPLEEHVAFGPPNPLTSPLSLTVGPGARLYVVEVSGQILRFNADGSFDVVVVNDATFQAVDVEFGPDGLLYALGIDANLGTSMVRRFTADGAFAGDLIAPGPLTNGRYLTFAAAAIPEVGGFAAMTAAAVASVIGWASRRRSRSV